MKRIVTEDPGRAHTLLAGAFGVPAQGMVLELNPVLGRLRTALSPFGAQSGGAVFLQGFPREGKGAQAYLIARDWLRLGQAGVDFRPGVVLVQGEEDLLELASQPVPAGQRHLVIVQRPAPRLDSEAQAELLGRILAKQCSLLVLAEAGLVRGTAEALWEVYGELASLERRQGRKGPVWIEMEGIPLKRLQLHLEGRSRIAGRKMEDEEQLELVELATIASESAAPGAPRVLLGLLHRCLDEAAQESDQSCRTILGMALASYLERQLAELEDGWKEKSRSLFALLSHLAEVSPWLAGRVPAPLLDRLLVHSAGFSLADLRNRHPGLLCQGGDEVGFRLPGALVNVALTGRGDGPYAELLLEDLRNGKMPVDAAAAYFLGLGRLDELVPWLPELRADRARWLGEIWVWQVERQNPEALLAMPRELQGGYLLAELRDGQCVRSLPSATDPAIWGSSWSALAAIEMDEEVLAAEIEQLALTQPLDEWWIEVLVEAGAEDLDATAVKLWLFLYDRLVDAGEDPGEDEKTGDDEARCLARLVLVGRLLDRLDARHRGDAGEKVLSQLLADLPRDQVEEILCRSCLLPGSRWPRLREVICRHLTLSARIFLIHLRLCAEELPDAEYSSLLVSELREGFARDDGIAAVALAEVLICLDAVHLAFIPGGRAVLEALRETWRSESPVVSFVREKILLALSAEEIDLFVAKLRGTLTELSRPLRLAAGAQALLGALLAVSGWRELGRRELARADRCLLDNEAGDVLPSTLFAHLLHRLKRESESRRSLGRDPLPPAALLYPQGKRLLAQDRDLEAVRYLDQALQHDPACLAIRLDLVWLYHRLNKQERVQDLLEGALEMVGEHPEVLRAWIRHCEAIGDFDAALDWCRKLCAMTQGEQERLRHEIAKAVSIAARAECMEEVFSWATLYVQRFGYHSEVFTHLVHALRQHEALPGGAPLLVREILRQLTPRVASEKVALLSAAGDTEALRAELVRLIRESDSTSLLPISAVLPEGPDRLLLELIGNLQADLLVEASVSLEDLSRSVAERGDLDLFRSVVHLGFAEEYTRRGMSGHAERHLDLATRAYSRALWRGFAGPRVIRLAAEITCLRLLVGMEEIPLGAADAVRELLLASLFENPEDWHLRELAARLRIAQVRSEALSAEIERLPEIVARHEEALLGEIDAVKNDPGQTALFRIQLALVHSLVELIEAAIPQPENRPSLQAFFEKLASSFLSGQPGVFVAYLDRGETLLRIAEGMVQTHGDSPPCLLDLLRKVKEHFEKASACETGNSGTADRVRLGIKLKRADILILRHELH